MERTNFWKDAVTSGAILGALLGVSFMVETRMQMSGSFTFYVLEYLVVLVLHYYLLHRFTRRYSLEYSAEEGFSFGAGYGYILSVSAFSGVIVGVVQYLYLNLYVGYANYTERLAAALTDAIAQSGATIPSSMAGMFSQSLDMIQNGPEPSLFGTIWGGIWLSLLFGLIFGLIIAGVLSRAPQPFDTQNDA